MQHARHSGGARFAQHRPGVVLRFAGVDDKRLRHFRGERDLRRKRGALGIARGIVVMIVEAALSDSNRSVAEKCTQARNIARLVELRGVVRVNSSRREYESGICGGQITSRCRD